MKNTDKQFLKQLGSHIARVRKSKGYSQDRLYLEAGFSRGTVSKIENGLVNPQIITLMKIAKTIGIPISVLLDFNPSKTKK